MGTETEPWAWPGATASAPAKAIAGAGVGAGVGDKTPDAPAGSAWVGATAGAAAGCDWASGVRTLAADLVRTSSVRASPPSDVEGSHSTTRLVSSPP